MSQHNGIDRSREMLNRIHDLEAGLPFASKRSNVEHMHSVTSAGGQTTANIFSFKAWKTGDTTIEMEPGDISLGPCSFIDWTDISGYDTTPDVTKTNTHVWLEIRTDSNPETIGSLGAGYAWMLVGSKSDMRAALDSTEILTKVVVPLVETTWDSDSNTDAWVTATDYAVGAIVHNGTTVYKCQTAHTSGTFATDLAAGKWATFNGIVKVKNLYCGDGFVGRAAG